MNFVKEVIKLPFNIIGLIFYLPRNLIKIYFLKNLKDNIFLQDEGGFGHTITSPLLLKYYYGNNWTLFFQFSKKRHNIYIKDVFNNLVFLNFSFFNFQSYYMNKFNFRLLYLILKIFSKKKLLFINDFMDSLPMSSINKNNNSLKTCNIRSKLFWLISQKKFNFINNSNIQIYNQNIDKIFKSKKKKLLFALRYKDHKENNPVKRDSRHINFYKNSLEHMVKKGWQIFLTGDCSKYPAWVKKNSNIFNFSKLEKYNINLDYYNFLSGMFSNACIGPHSGALWYNVARKTKCLVLEHSFLGDVMPNSIITYRNLINNDFSLIKKYFNNYDFLTTKKYKDFYKNSSELSKYDINEIIIDFINNYNNFNYGIEIKKLNIKDGLFVDSKAKFSPIWFKKNIKLIKNKVC
jgi:hypothetical protein